MSLATSANGTKLKCVPSNACPLMMRANGFGTNVQFMTRLRNIRYSVLYAGHRTRT
jgi:hypothetical protein